MDVEFVSLKSQKRKSLEFGDSITTILHNTKLITFNLSEKKYNVELGCHTKYYFVCNSIYLKQKWKNKHL